MPSDYCYPPVNRAVIDTGCYVTSVGEFNHERGLPYPPPGHPSDYRFDWSKGRNISDTTLVGISRGSGRWETRQGRGVLEAGNVLFLPSHEWHRYRPAANTGWCEKWLCLRGALVHRLIETKIIPSQPEVIKCGNWPEWEERLDRLRHEVTEHDGRNRPSWGARALSILLELWEVDDTPLAVDSPTGEPDDLTRQALRFIEENSHRPILVGDVARACGRTRRTLERLFLKARLASIAETIATERMSRAKYLLRETQLSVKQVAGDSGFQSSQHLIACFRRMDDCTPSEYRECK